MSSPSVLLDDDVAFDRDLHAYREPDGARRMSVTQALAIGGLIDYSMVPTDVLERAQSRGIQVHSAAAIIDRGEALDEYIVSETIEPYVEGYLQFLREMKFLPEPEWVERPMIVELFGQRVGMMPDSIGTINGVLTLIDRKTSATAHPAWAVQTAGYEAGLKAAGLQVRARMAVQLTRAGKYKVYPYDNPGDLEIFASCYRVAAWKLKHRLAVLD